MTQEQHLLQAMSHLDVFLKNEPKSWPHTSKGIAEKKWRKSVQNSVKQMSDKIYQIYCNHYE